MSFSSLLLICISNVQKVANLQTPFLANNHNAAVMLNYAYGKYENLKDTEPLPCFPSSVTLQSQQEMQRIHRKVPYPLKAPYGFPCCKPASSVLYLGLLFKYLNGDCKFLSKQLPSLVK